MTMSGCLAGQEDFELTAPFKKFEVDIDVWSGMTRERRQKLFDKFMKKQWLVNSRTIVSSDGAQAFIGPGPNGGKKPHQKKEEKKSKDDHN